MELNDKFHQEILDSAPERFPVESFFVLRRSGATVDEALEALGYQQTQLSFQMRAALNVDPNDHDSLKKLLGFSV